MDSMKLEMIGWIVRDAWIRVQRDVTFHNYAFGVCIATIVKSRVTFICRFFEQIIAFIFEKERLHLFLECWFSTLIYILTRISILFLSARFIESGSISFNIVYFIAFFGFLLIGQFDHTLDVKIISIVIQYAPQLLSLHYKGKEIWVSLSRSL